MKKLILLLTVIGITVTIFLIGAPALAKNSCGGVDTSIISCDSDGSGGVKDSAIWQILKLIIQIMTGGVVIAAVGGMVYASILYTSSGGNPETRKKSMNIITNTAIGIVAFALMWALLNFLLPGGISL